MACAEKKKPIQVRNDQAWTKAWIARKRRCWRKNREKTKGPTLRGWRKKERSLGWLSHLAQATERMNHGTIGWARENRRETKAGRETNSLATMNWRSLVKPTWGWPVAHWLSKCVHQTCIIGITRKLVRDASSWPHPVPIQTEILFCFVLTHPPGDSDAC